MNIVIEIAKPKDVEKILNIYKPYILRFENHLLKEYMQ